ncbi:hypothetical protein JCM10296v2_003226 [Rhodotorula toruloides]
MPASSLVKSVALAGAGTLGSVILPELLNAGLATTVVTRKDSKRDSSFPTGVVVKAVDYASLSSLVDALKGVDVVIATLTDRDAQVALVKAAKEAGVKLFVPGEFGNPTTNIKQSEVHPIMYGKKQIQDLLKSVGLPALLVFNGPFPDTTFNAFLGFDPTTGHIRLVGKGDTPISWTTRLDVARFLVHHLTTLTSFPSPSEPAILRIEGDRKTYNQVVNIYRRLYPKQDVRVMYVPVEDAEKIAKDVQSDFIQSFIEFLLLSWEKGATVDDGHELDNARWPEWNPKSVEAVLKEQA